jgi:hypothetical protein
VTREIARANLLSIIAGVQEAIRSLGTFDRHLWAAALALYRTGDAGAFIDDFAAEIENQLTRAWNAGAQEMGVSPDEFSDADKEQLDLIIKNEHDFVLRLAQDISDARGDTLDEFRSQFRSRIGLWVNRFREAQNTARVYFGTQAKFQWTLGATEEHCRQCTALNGIVAFGREWEAYGFQPQHPPNPLLDCGGWRCECQLTPTDKRRTIRARDRLTEIALLGRGGL